ncbi:semaphorin-4E-like [Megalops cyprinoides]|uniref:semaphorin-4E-like n=1 Tax=Megalops cyprinoides TaxID=118141 RepID=UPI001863D6F9|nr:semaphorin-4E-like [Megalops cyprinoides]
MYTMPPPSMFCLLLFWTLSNIAARERIPRHTIPYQSDLIKLFREEGRGNYSTMLLQEDRDVLLLGGREAVYALDINDITNRKAAVTWQATEKGKKECTNKGKHAEECQNYIRVLHEMSDGRIYVCGTNAFDPACGYIKYTEGQLSMGARHEDGKGKCPFDPLQRYSSVMVGGDLYSATSNNFLGSEPVIARSSATPVRSEFKTSWLNEPSFIYMDQVPESEGSPEQDDDKVYLFFSETAVEYDFYNKLTVSRVARVCKGDVGGQRTLQRKWTSFLKARLDCPVPESRLPHVVQDVFLLRGSDWRNSVFYAVFTSQPGSVDLSTVCAYSVTDIGDVFSKGRFKTPVTVASSHVKWVMYSEDLPEPRPGACINKEARALGIERSLDLPDKTLRFVQDQPLMDQAVMPRGGEPELVERGVVFTRIVVDRVKALDGSVYEAMFIGTDKGFVQKAVNYDGEMVVIEEMQLFQTPQPIQILRLSSKRGLLYAGSDVGAVQVSVGQCGRHASCLDCVLARDPYCAWDPSASRCIMLSLQDNASKGTLIQDVKNAKGSTCPDPGKLDPKPTNVTLILGSNIQLKCRPDSNLAQVQWRFASRPLPTSEKFYLYSEGLLIQNASAADAGLYACVSEEEVKGRRYGRTEALYELVPAPGPEYIAPRTDKRVQGQSLVTLQVLVALLAVLLAALLAWNVWRGHIPLPCWGAAPAETPAPQSPSPSPAVTPETINLMLPANCNTNNNHPSNGEGSHNLDNLKYIDEESEI